MGDHFISARYWFTSPDPRGLPACRGEAPYADSLLRAWTIGANPLAVPSACSVWHPAPESGTTQAFFAGSLPPSFEDLLVRGERFGGTDNCPTVRGFWTCLFSGLAVAAAHPSAAAAHPRPAAAH